MFKYFPHTQKDIEEMLARIGVKDIEELFSDVPKQAVHKNMDLPSSLSEIELRKHLNDLDNKNKSYKIFRGAGSYDVYTPSVIPALLSRQEFLTSYTPYQPEISQGTLQYIFEFQSMICELTGMDVSNASVYDGATATAEAIFMAVNQTKRKKVLISKTINPRYLEVVKTYMKYRNYEIEMIDEVDNSLDSNDLFKKLDDSVACVVSQYPNYYGVIENYDFASKIKENKSLFILNCDLSTLPILKTPKELGADIVCGDGQTLGIPLSFGGPYVGYMACLEKYLRKLPGRIVGMTNDVEGKRGYVLTLQAREQHIRREKANSNICSNQSLMALHTVLYTSLMGKEGLKEVAKRAYNHAHYLKEELLKTGLFVEENSKPFFKEFLLKSKIDLQKLNQKLLENGVLGGLILDGDKYLLCATEMRTKEEMDQFKEIVEEFSCTIN